jgi:predicted DNA-binding protein with PD1-like motif
MSKKLISIAPLLLSVWQIIRCPKSRRPSILLFVALSLVFVNLIQAHAADMSAANGSETSQFTAATHNLPSTIKDELTPSEVCVFGESPKVSWQAVTAKRPRSFLLVFGKNDDLIAGLYKFAQANQIRGAYFSGIGAVGCAALGFFDENSRSYKVIKVPTQAELASLIGNISLKENKYVVHTHGVISLQDGRCLGGHVLFAPAWPTVEVMLTETDTAMERHTDIETGLSLFDQPSEQTTK